MEDLIAPSSYFDKEDFEAMADSVRTKIQNYFSQLIEVIRQRQSQLTSELDEIISHYRLERIRVRGKVNELEKMKKFHEDLRFSSSIGDIHSELLSKIDSELTQLKHNSSMTVEFEWTRKFARNANKIGKLTRIPSNITSLSNLPQIDEAESGVTMKNTDCSLFIFSQRLYEGLIYKTDVGPIPRDSYCEDHLKSTFTEYSNWRVVIEGCYWCRKATNLNQYMYVCNKKCYQYFHEWCRMKLFEFCGDSLCMYPGCEMLSLNDCKFCSESHQLTLEREYKTIQSIITGKVGVKIPYWYSSNQLITKSPTMNKITKYFPKASIQDATPSPTDISLLSAYNSLSKQSTCIESPSKHKNPFK